MHNLYDILTAIRSESKTSMNYCETFMEIQTILVSFNDQIKPFNKIRFRAGKYLQKQSFLVYRLSPMLLLGNERYLAELSRRLSGFLNRKGLTPGGETSEEQQLELLKITFYLLLNGEIAPDGGLAKEDRVCHLVGVIPPIPKCVLFHCIWELKLMPQFFEFIAVAPSRLVVEFLDDALVDSWKALDTVRAVENTSLVIAAVYRHGFLLSFVEGEDSCELEEDLKRMGGFLVGIISTFFSTDQGKYADLKKEDYEGLVGQILRHFMTALISCFKLFLSNPIANVKQFQLFQTNNDRCLKLDRSRPVINEISMLNSTLLNHLQLVVESVTLDMFLTLLEIDITKILTLQRCVGELSYRLCELLQSDPVLEHDVLPRLKSISMKPLDITDIIKEASIGQIISNIQTVDSHQIQWMEEFLSRGKDF